MKKNILYAALACMAILFTGCNEDDFGNGNVQAVEKHMGDEIKFGGSASYNINDKQKAATRTVYGGYVSGATAESVYWVANDQVRLYCPQALVQTADYQVSTADGKSATTGLDKMTAAGLQWANPEKPHTFYGVYPIPADDVLKTNQVLTGIIPDVQGYDSCNVDNNGNYVFAPDMKNAYMVAKTQVNKPNNIPDDVYLKFAPIATALEIEIKNNSGNDLVLREVHFSSATRALSGEFTANLDNMTLGGKDSDNVRYASGCPSGIKLADNATKAVGVRLLVNGSAITLAKDKSLKFTVFMLPSTDGANADAVNDLKMTLIGDDGGKKTGTFSGVNIVMSKKNYIHALPLGTGKLTYNQAEWLKYVEDSKVMSALSIPGAGGASSGNVFGKNGVDNYLEQSLSIKELWNTGIRCFEFTVDCYDSYTYDDNGNVTNYTHDGTIGNNNVYCNAQNTGLTLTTCVDSVKTLLGQHPEEFAMVIITYQQQSGWNKRKDDGTVNQIRHPKEFMSQFNTFWTNLQMPTGTRKALYNHGATVKDARGSLFCIARPTSNGEDNYAVITPKTVTSWIGRNFVTIASTTYTTSIETPVVSDPNILVIHGWGALKDKWYARGFTECIYHRGNGWTSFTDAIKNADWSKAMGYNAKRPGRPFDTSTKTDDATNKRFTTLSTGTYASVDYDNGTTKDLGLTSSFYYSTVCNKHQEPVANAAWVQEWARVSPKTAIYTITQENGDKTYVKWIESKTEKEDDVLECLTKALGDNEGKVIYINSLCGYYITDQVQKSIYPNSLTDYNIKIGEYYTSITKKVDILQPATLSTMSSDAGMCGDIAKFASDMNKYFLDKLQEKLNSDGRLGGSTGIVMMDRVAKDGDAAKIPSIIIANNFAPDVNAEDPNVDIPGEDLGGDDNGNLSKGYRDITWGEWEN